MKKIILLTSIISVFSINFSFAQEKKYKIHTIAFYNVENLFDTINDVNKNDEASPIMEIENGRSEISFALKSIKSLTDSLSRFSLF